MISSLHRKEILADSTLDEFADLLQYKKFTKEILKEKNEKINEFENLEKMLANAFQKERASQRNERRKQLLPVLAVIPMILLFTSFAISDNSLFFSDSNDEILNPSSSMRTGYFIENLKGDVIQTWKAWNLVEETSLIININNANQFPASKVDIIKNVIMSEEILRIDNSQVDKGPQGTSTTFFTGWKGATSSINDHELNSLVPRDFRIIESAKNEGNVIITLSNLRNSDGYTGYTKSTVEGNEILKSHIRIFDVDNLSDKELETITRHEMGHALGLNHSSDPNDLMYPTIGTDYPFISECTVEALHSLYDGDFNSNYVCNS